MREYSKCDWVEFFQTNSRPLTGERSNSKDALQDLGGSVLSLTPSPKKHKAHPTPCKNISKPVPDCSEKPGHGGGKRASERRRGAACETRDHARRPLTVMNGALIQAELRREISRRRKLETGTRQRGMATLITCTLEVGAITRGLRRGRRRDRGAARARRRERGAERARERWRNREDNAHGEP